MDDTVEPFVDLESFVLVGLEDVQGLEGPFSELLHQILKMKRENQN